MLILPTVVLLPLLWGLAPQSKEDGLSEAYLGAQRWLKSWTYCGVKPPTLTNHNSKGLG